MGGRRSRGATRDATTAGEGVLFPLVGGRRSSTATGRAVFAGAATGLDDRLAADIRGEESWRRTYPGYLVRLLMAAATVPEAALHVARGGLAELHSRLVFSREGTTRSLGEAFTTYRCGRFDTEEIKGNGARVRELTVPYRGRALRGAEMRRQLADWVRDGIAEPSFAEAIELVMDHPDWLDLRDRVLVLLGAGSELGPLPQLCRWGATVAAVDLPGRARWERILAVARDGAGRLYLPVRPPGAAPDLADRAGADLLTEAPEVRSWLAGLDRRLLLGDYGYADGERFPRLALAADAIIVDLLQSGYVGALCYLATPTDVFAVPAEVVADARARYSRTPRLRRAVALGSGGRLLAPAYAGPDALVHAADGRQVGVADCLVLQQGPNYALAKSLQRWRATVARAEGVLTSVHVAPPTRTASVLRNRLLAAAYRGAARFGIETFDPGTTRALMAALLVHDLHNPRAAARPDVTLRHPLDLFVGAANPGGLWRCGYRSRTVLAPAVLSGALHRRPTRESERS